MTDGFAFGNFTYSCVDTSLYGLVRQNYFSYQPDPFSPGDSTMVLDSSSVKLGRVDPATGIVTTISPVTMPYGGYSVNGGKKETSRLSTGFFILNSGLCPP
jgi:hypothetical protein